MDAAVESTVMQATTLDKQAVSAKPKRLGPPVMTSQQMKIEDLTGPVIRLEAQLALLTGAAMLKRLSGS